MVILLVTLVFFQDNDNQTLEELKSKCFEKRILCGFRLLPTAKALTKNWYGVLRTILNFLRKRNLFGGRSNKSNTYQ